ncbi:odorant receptor 82a [Agrilus planipennis]|uniref:Odorant receptor 82a n=1 Tax=Agrilus planipennis TaxID=224129 RepID=A0A1W4WU17_AGRPL|nr:odorant receptor 82a [Agrilus planipennis]
MLSIVAFLQLGISTLTITFLSFCVTKERQFSITTFYMFSFLYSIIVQFFIYTYHGTNLQEKTKNISLAIYESKWHLFDISIQKDIAFAVMGAQKKLTLTAGGFLVINNNTLLQVFKSSFSYITLLLSLSK